MTGMLSDDYCIDRHRPSENARSASIRDLNDSFRTTFVGGVVVLTADVRSLSSDSKARVLDEVKRFGTFTVKADPRGEHCRGELQVGNKRLLWKVEYFDRTLTEPSENPADPDITTRVLTISRA